jgi:hypothetical protein
VARNAKAENYKGDVLFGYFICWEILCAGKFYLTGKIMAIAVIESGAGGRTTSARSPADDITDFIFWTPAMAENIAEHPCLMSGKWLVYPNSNQRMWAD